MATENVIHLEHGHIVTSIKFAFQVLNGLSDSKGFWTFQNWSSAVLF